MSCFCIELLTVKNEFRLFSEIRIHYIVPTINNWRFNIILLIKKM